MNIKKMVRKALLKEGKHSVTNDYGCVMVFFKVDGEAWESIQSEIDDDDLYLGAEGETGFGKETDPHVTILYGIHTDVPDEDVEKLIDKVKEPNVSLGKVSSFSNPKFDVIKFDVESAALHKYNKLFKTLPHTSTFPEYHPHVTIAYLKKGMADKYIKKLNERKPLDVEVNNIGYSKANGDRKDYDLK